MTKSHSNIIKLIATLFIGSLISLILLLYVLVIPSSNSKSTQVLNIPKNSTVTQIATILKNKSLIHSTLLFKLTTRLTNKDKKLRAGYFLIPISPNQQQLIRILSTENGAYNLQKIIIPEGFSITQIGTVLENQNICKKETFEEFAHKKAKQQFSSEFNFIKNIPSSITTIEGYLFPNTYFFKKNEALNTIVKTMLIEFEKKIHIPYQNNIKIKKYRYNFHQLLTLASMIEKESRVIAEMPRISSVFYNRLRKRMRLSSDPTVVYALGKSYKDKVYYKDLKIKSPYNTYRVGGFPPSPIASPGKSAFIAACNPESSSFLFFVAMKDGRHYFSNTYQEHLTFQRQMKRRKKTK